jgi:EAL domain-containing protein (putative c-di-GMP-specific phosphodiesterase class I)
VDDEGGPSNAAAAGALTLALGLPKAKSSPRIAALAADGGKRCLFRSIVDLEGRPVAEVAVLHALEEARVWTEPSILAASTERDFAPIAALFRDRAVREFGTAPGLPRDVTLYLPWYCALASVDAIGPTIAALLSRSAIASSRVVLELSVATRFSDPGRAPRDGASNEEADLHLLEKRVVWLRGMGVEIGLRVSGDLALDRRAIAALRPEWVHIPKAPSDFDDAGSLRSLLDAVSTERDDARTVIGGVDSPEEAAFAEGLGARYLSGDAVAPARFLC